MSFTRAGIVGRDITLYARFLDSAGNTSTTDATPTVQIIDSTGTTALSATNTYTSAETDDPGLYRFDWTIPDGSPDGYYQDVWTAKIGEESITATFDFLVKAGGSAIVTPDSEWVPNSSELSFTFSKCESETLSLLLKILKKRLKNDGTVPRSDGSGGFDSVPCPIFSDDELICFLINGLNEFNQWPHFTNFTFCDSEIGGIFSDIVLQGAFLLAVAAQSLIEKGREFSISDNGVTYQPPAVSDILTTQYNAQLAYYKEKLKMIKASLKPQPLGLGGWRIVAVAPAYRRLRHLRSRQII